MRFGRLQRQYDAARGEYLVSTLDQLTGNRVDDTIRKNIVSGASELDLVRSGLDDTMRTAFQEIRDTLKQYPAIKDYRTGCYVLALGKIVQTYQDIGLINPTRKA
jgi:glutamate dehydrogenase (NAD(P)+)